MTKKAFLITFIIIVCFILCCDSVKEEKEKIVLSFETNGGEEIADIEWIKGERPIKPKRDGYVFDGWYEDKALNKIFDENTERITNIVIYAKWLKEYVINFDLNGGTMTSKVTITYVENKKIDLPTPRKEGYTFIGWYEDNDKIETINNKDYDLKAEWEANKINVKIYCIETEKIIDEMVINYNETIDFNNLILKGYRFISCEDSYSNITEPTTIKVHCEKLNNVLVFVNEKEQTKIYLVGAETIGFYLEFNKNGITDVDIQLKNCSYSNQDDEKIKFIFSSNTNIINTKLIANVKGNKFDDIYAYGYKLIDNELIEITFEIIIMEEK